MKGLPGPAAHPLRQLRHVRRDFLGYLLEAAKLGDLVRLRPAPGVSIILVNHPALIREVLVTRAAEFRKTRMTGRLVGKFLGQGLVLSEGEEHQRQRRLLQPLFAPRRLAECAPALHAQAQDFLAARAGAPIDLPATMTELALQGVLRILFGTHGHDTSDVSDAMRTFADSMAQRFRSIPLPDWLPTRRNRSDRAAIRTLDQAIDSLLAERRLHVEGPRHDVVDVLLQARKAGALGERDIRDQIATLYFAGHETTAKLLTWSSLLLVTHPDCYKALRAEAETLPQQPSYEELEALPLLDQFISETLRLYPPAWVFDREPVHEAMLGGASLPAGTTLYVSPWAMHRDARYFDEPGTFRPSRFSAGWEQRIDKHAYIPFGSGARHCIGRGLALVQAKTVLVAILRNYDLIADVANLDALARPGATLGVSSGLSVRLEQV